MLRLAILRNNGDDYGSHRSERSYGCDVSSPNSRLRIVGTWHAEHVVVVLSLGATGAVGTPLLGQLVSDSSPYTRVVSFARREHPAPPSSSKVKFEEVVVDFEKLFQKDASEQAKFAGVKADAVFITMGTTRAAAGSGAAFEKIDRGYVLAAAKALHDPKHPATMVYCSSGQASSASRFPYLKSKGLTEEGLASMYAKTIIMRPGFLQNAQRKESRVFEKLSQPFFNLGAKISDSLQADVKDVAAAMIKAAQLGPEKLNDQVLATPLPNNFRLEPEAAGHQIAIVLNNHILQLTRPAQSS